MDCKLQSPKRSPDKGNPITACSPTLEGLSSFEEKGKKMRHLLTIIVMLIVLCLAGCQAQEKPKSIYQQNPELYEKVVRHLHREYVLMKQRTE